MTALIVVAVVLAVLVLLILAFWSRYKTVGADEAMIVTGSYLGVKNVIDDAGRKVKIVRGGGAFVVPIFQQWDKISLLSHKLDVSTPEVYTEQGVPVMANGTAIIKIEGSNDGIATAAEQFLGKGDESIREEATEVLEGHLRAILGSMTVEEIYKERDKFAQQVQEVAAVDLQKMGLAIVSFTIKDVQDRNGYLDALGKPRIAAVKRDAEIAEAQALKETRIKRAEAETSGCQAELIRDTNIAEAEKEKELKIASYKKEQDSARAEADQAYSIQKARSEQEVVSEEMKIQIVKKQKEIELEEQEILRKERQYDAEVKKKADADRYAVEQAAEADKAKRMREADAHQYQIESEAKAQSERVKLDGFAQAEAERAKGTAQAEIIRARGLAEAEAKEKLAEAFDKFGKAAVLEMVVKMLPELASEVAKPLANIDKITVIDSGNGDGGANKVANYVTHLMGTLPEQLKDVSGVDIQTMIQSLAGQTLDETRQKKKENESS